VSLGDLRGTMAREGVGLVEAVILSARSKVREGIEEAGSVSQYEAARRKAQPPAPAPGAQSPQRAAAGAKASVLRAADGAAAPAARFAKPHRPPLRASGTVAREAPATGGRRLLADEDGSAALAGREGERRVSAQGRLGEGGRRYLGEGGRAWEGLDAGAHPRGAAGAGGGREEDSAAAARAAEVDAARAAETRRAYAAYLSEQRRAGVRAQEAPARGEASPAGGGVGAEREPAALLSGGGARTGARDEGQGRAEVQADTPAGGETRRKGAAPAQPSPDGETETARSGPAVAQEACGRGEQTAKEAVAEARAAARAAWKAAQRRATDIGAATDGSWLASHDESARAEEAARAGAAALARGWGIAEASVGTEAGRGADCHSPLSAVGAVTYASERPGRAVSRTSSGRASSRATLTREEPPPLPLEGGASPTDALVTPSPPAAPPARGGPAKGAGLRGLRGAMAPAKPLPGAEAVSAARATVAPQPEPSLRVASLHAVGESKAKGPVSAGAGRRESSAPSKPRGVWGIVAGVRNRLKAAKPAYM
jgi:hypothetical protein